MPSSAAAMSPSLRLDRVDVDPLPKRSITPPPSPSRSRRGSRTDGSSFISVREVDSGPAQTFFDHRFSPAAPPPSCLCHTDSAASSSTTMATALTLIPQPPAPHLGHCCPCGRLDAWKLIRLRGRCMSRSSEDLRLQHRAAFDDDDASDGEAEAAAGKGSSPPLPMIHQPGKAPLEALPLEILEQILIMLVVDIPPNGAEQRNLDLVSCLRTSRTMYAATLTVLYRHITIPHSLIFSKFLAQIASHPQLGTIVRRLDFSHFSSVGLGRTRRMNAELQMVTATTLARCLDLTPRLREFLVQEHVDGDLDERVLTKLFCDMPLLRAMDFCGCSSSSFREAFSRVVNASNPLLPKNISLQRLSLHECGTIPTAALETLLPRLDRLTHLDLSHTLVTPTALSRIPHTARLTHLNLSKCSRLSGDAVVKFVTTHPAARESLVYLNLASDPSRFRLLSGVDVTNLLAAVPPTVRALNLNGAKVKPSHLTLLQPLARQLEELGLGYSELSLNDIQSLYRPAATSGSAWVQPTLHYLDLSGIGSVTPSALLSSSCVLLRPQTLPLTVLELDAKTVSGLRERASPRGRPGSGWLVRDLGRRGWYVRDRSASAAQSDGDRRDWKMGALWWGMRKVPVAWSDVGGLYGHYMFKR